jgi:hypothetical protein
MNPSKQQLFAIVTGDLEEKIAAKWPEPILYIDFNAMTNSSFRRRSGLIKDVVAFLSDNPNLIAALAAGRRDLFDVLSDDYAATRDKLFVSQFTIDFATSFNAFCDKVMRHIDKLETTYGTVGADLKEKFLTVVTAPELVRAELNRVMHATQRILTESFMSDERGEITKFHMTLDKALELGLLKEIEFVPYAPRAHVSPEA